MPLHEVLPALSATPVIVAFGSTIICCNVILVITSNLYCKIIEIH